jgi:hypothetical protein
MANVVKMVDEAVAKARELGEGKVWLGVVNAMRPRP